MGRALKVALACMLCLAGLAGLAWSVKMLVVG